MLSGVLSGVKLRCIVSFVQRHCAARILKLTHQGQHRIRGRSLTPATVLFAWSVHSEYGSTFRYTIRTKDCCGQL